MINLIKKLFDFLFIRPKQNGWIKFKDKYPPIGVNVIILYRNGLNKVNIGTRISSTTILVDNRFALSIYETDNSIIQPFAICWAYNNGQELGDIY